MRTLVEALALSALGVALGFVLNAASPRPVSLDRAVLPAAESGEETCSEQDTSRPTVLARISVAEATAACDACNAAFVDARSAREFEEGHVTGALHLPPKGHPDEDEMLQALRAYPLVIVYDGESSCRLAEGVARRLAASGISNLRILDGAWPAWLAAGGPGASGLCAECRHSGEDADSPASFHQEGAK